MKQRISDKDKTAKNQSGIGLICQNTFLAKLAYPHQVLCSMREFAMVASGFLMTPFRTQFT
jgi:hypothetical protein